MKIVLTGGGSGGHFYPLIAVASKVKEIAFEGKLVEPKIYYLSSNSYNKELLSRHNVYYKWVPTGKNRLYFSFLNFTDIFKIILGFFIALYRLFIIFPDIVFSKGGHDSVPTCLAARVLGIPIIMHDSDSIPGRASLLISRFADRIAVSYEESAQYYKNKNIVAYTSQPIMDSYLPEITFKRLYNSGRKTILISGGSQGSVVINDTVLQILPELISKYNVIHQCGASNFEDVKLRSGYILSNYSKNGYELNSTLDFSSIYPRIDLVISRAGSSIFEYIEWELPSIIVPISPKVSRDQSNNATNMQIKGIAKIIEENNFTPGLLLNTIDGVLGDEVNYMNIVDRIRNHKNRNASRLIAEEIIKMIESHAK